MALFGGRQSSSSTTARAGLLSNVRQKTTDFRLEVNYKKLDNLADSVILQVRDAVSKATVDIQAEAQKIIRDKDIIDTGNLLNSLYYYTTTDGMTGTVVVGAFYGIYIEFGTVYVAARPFLGPAVTIVKREFFAAVREAINRGIELA